MTESKRIFVAHAKEDKIRVRKLCQELENNGFEVWFDEKSLDIGAKWEIEIKKAIKNSKFFLACFSKHSVPKRGFVQKELRIALSELEQIPQSNTYFLPVLLDNIDHPELSVGTINLSDFQFFRIYKKIERRRLIYFLLKSTQPDTYSYDKEMSSSGYDLDYALFLKVKNVILKMSNFDIDVTNLRFFTMLFYGKKGWIIFLDIRIVNNTVLCVGTSSVVFNDKHKDKIKDYLFERNNELKVGALFMTDEKNKTIGFRSFMFGSAINESELNKLIDMTLHIFNHYIPEIIELSNTKTTE